MRHPLRKVQMGRWALPSGNGAFRRPFPAGRQDGTPPCIGPAFLPMMSHVQSSTTLPERPESIASNPRR